MINLKSYSCLDKNWLNKLKNSVLIKRKQKTLKKIEYKDRNYERTFSKKIYLFIDKKQ